MKGRGRRNMRKKRMKRRRMKGRGRRNRKKKRI